MRTTISELKQILNYSKLERAWFRKPARDVNGGAK